MIDLPVDADHDGPWLSCMRRDGRLMYRNRNVPATAEIGGEEVDVDDILRHHEEPEWKDIQNRLQALGREPTSDERKDIYLAAHQTFGTPSERNYVRSQGIDWSAWSAWCRGQEAKVERGPFVNEPTDADVKPIPHGHGELAVTDAASADPTGTGALRKRFMRASDKRWQHATRLVREAVGQGDILGLSSPNLNSIALRAKHGGVAGADKTAGFHAWLESVLRDVVVGHDGSWMTPFIAEAERMAADRSRGIGARSIPPDHELHPHRSLAVSELRGIASVAVQQGTRAAAAAISKRSRPAAAARTISQALEGAMKRARLMADYLVSKAFTAATVAHFRASGIGTVGIVPERYAAKEGGLVRQLVRDARRKKRREVDLDIVQVLTAGDDAVCEDCEDASEAGPYTLDEASDLVPLHPRCRCALIPAFDARFSHSEL